MTEGITLLVTSVYPGPRGGAVFLGRDPSGQPVRAVADSAHIGRPPRRSETWRVDGTFARRPQFGDQLYVERARPVKPDGRVIVYYLTHHSAFRGIGIGPAKVAQLSKAFGDRLVPLLDLEDVEKFSAVLSKERAEKLIERWRENAKEASLMAFLDSCAADRIAHSLGMGAEDNRRLIAAVESVMYTRLHAEKDTRVDAAALQNDLLKLLRLQDLRVAQRALGLATAEGAIVGDEHIGYQAFGCAVMEKFLAAKFQGLLSLRVPQQDREGGATTLVHDALVAFEQATRISLNTDQRSAVKMAMSHRPSVLKGGAGVGKTTVLKAIGAVAEARKCRIVQMALAGRAAQRIREATGRDAYTITAVLNPLKQGRLALGEDDLVIIDESSMLDLILVYRLMRALPERFRLLLVGDPSQLPPIGPGLVFHALAESDAVPQQELTQVHRQAAGSSIPRFAQEVRHGRVPAFDSFAGAGPGVTFIKAAGRHITSTVIDVRQALANHSEVQILGVTKRGEAGVETINAAIHKLVAADQPVVHGWGPC